MICVYNEIRGVDGPSLFSNRTTWPSQIRKGLDATKLSVKNIHFRKSDSRLKWRTIEMFVRVTARSTKTLEEGWCELKPTARWGLTTARRERSVWYSTAPQRMRNFFLRQTTRRSRNKWHQMASLFCVAITWRSPGDARGRRKVRAIKEGYDFKKRQEVTAKLERGFTHV